MKKADKKKVVVKNVSKPVSEDKSDSLKPGKLPLSIKLKLIFRSRKRTVEKPKGTVFLKTPIDILKEIYHRAQKKREKIISEKTEISPSLQLRSIKKKVDTALGEEMPSTLLAEEVKSIKKILEQKDQLKIYQPSFIGSFANLILKRLTFYLIETFPDFFKTMYDSLRLANIRVLSNTYINVMLLMMVVIPSFSLVFFALLFIVLNNPLFLIVAKTIIMALITAAVVFLGFYAYPFIRISSRKRDINANLPFAINHIAAVAGSGVTPAKMFKLISESQEYGDIAIEIEKIVEYIDLFGYDLLTALKSVAATTPSIVFKSFLDGIVSTIESGGNINSYLKQKAEEAMLSYELERQKYTETITTYSDIYTGILIAAPLFFVIALSLVAMLGGAIGGVDVRVIIVVGAYFVIPILNIFFIVFLELTQPEI